MPGIEDALEAAGGPEAMEIERFFSQKDRHYAKTFIEEQAKFEKFHEEIRQGIHACKVQRASCAHLDGQVTAALGEVDKDIREKVRHLRHGRHSGETRLEKLSDSSLAEARGLMAEERASRDSAHEYNEQVTNEVCHLYNDLEQARNYRLRKSEKLQEVVHEKLEEISIAIEAEAHMRDESTHTLLELFGKMGNKMQSEIDDVRDLRKASTSRLLNLMEVVLPHLEQARINHIKMAKEKIEDKKAALELAENIVGKFEKRQSMTVKRKSTMPTKGFDAAGNPVEAPELPPPPQNPGAAKSTMDSKAVEGLLPMMQGSRPR